MKKNILVVFGGVSSEHEVSIITGLQILENIDKEIYEPISLYISKSGEFQLMPNLRNRKAFLKAKRLLCTFGKDSKGSFVKYGTFNKKIYIYSVYLALHGGMGEGGQLQGLLECYDFAYTSADYESSTICMNKSLTKEILTYHNIPTAKGISFFDMDFKNNPKAIADNIKKTLGLPVIIKPTHLGSTIGINVAQTAIELDKYLSAAILEDKEILVEEFLADIKEYNISVRTVNGEIELSEVEEPVRKSIVLSFEDKYANGAKKTGGMANLDRNLPAKISTELHNKISELAIKTYKALRCSQMVRIDFIESKGSVYVCEVNSIPGSMAFYLWEAKGILFKDQITSSIEASIEYCTNMHKKRFSYSTDIVEKFVSI